MRTTLLVDRTPRDISRHMRKLASAAFALAVGLTALLSVSAIADPVAVNPSVMPQLGLAAAPVLPIGKKLIAFSKNAVGFADQAHVVTTICPPQINEEISGLYVKFQFTPGPCDEGFSKSTLNGTLVCMLHIDRRKSDLRGCFSGDWRLLSATGAPIAACTMEGTVGCGTHRPPGAAPMESCTEPKHFEGKMTGRVYVGHYQGAEICATLAGTGPLQPATPQQMSVEGVVISKCITD